MKTILFLLGLMAVYLSIAATRMNDCDKEIATRDAIINSMQIERDSLINQNAILAGQILTYKKCCFNRLK